MCCGEKVDRRFARNVKKPSMFLSSLVGKRKTNRRATKPSMLLDAVLTNAINNIKNDKILSKFNNISQVKTISRTNRKKKSKKFTAEHINNEDNTSKEETEKELSSCTSILVDVDEFFEELRNIKPRKNEKDCGDLNMTEPSSSSAAASYNNDLYSSHTQHIIDNFIETGVYETSP
jgi:hypothetical protein